MIKPIAKLNPVRWIDTSNINSGFDGNFAKDQLRSDQTYRPYYQPFNQSDPLVMQVISDEVPPNVDILDCFNFKVASIGWTIVPVNINGLANVGFSIYEINYPLISIPEGRYYLSFGDKTSEPIDIAENHPNTVLIKYKHSYNDNDVVFNTGIEFQFRMDSYIGFDKPVNEEEVYPDQKHNLTQLNSLAFRNFKYYIGFQYGVPFWIFDKYNIIRQCDQITYDGIGYQVPKGVEYEEEKNFDNNFIGGSIDLQPINNNFTRYDTNGNLNPTLSFTPVQKTDSYLNIGADILVSGKFKKRSLLEKVSVDKYSTDPVLIKLGTTVGGSEIGTINVDTNIGITETLEYLFEVASTLYISGISAVTGSDVDIWLIWKQLDEAPVIINQSSGSGGKLMAGLRTTWTEVQAGDLSRLWDLATGLGKANTNAFGWTIAGFNGTDIVDGVYMVGADVTSVSFDPATLGTLIGANTKPIIKDNLPAVGIPMFNSLVGSSGGDTPTPTSNVARARNIGAALDYELVKGANGVEPTLGLTAKLGIGADFNVQPRSLITLWIVKLEDDI